MVRGKGRTVLKAECSPHPRGDGPGNIARPVLGLAFSPPAWGWSGRTTKLTDAGPVLPTRVGMVRRPFAAWPRRSGSPHPRGDGPPHLQRISEAQAFSPPAWGWSAQIGSHVPRGAVLPTRVGMVRCSWAHGPSESRSPHPRGDGPYLGVKIALVAVFSPPAWGWSEDRDGIRLGATVLPTRVGMVRFRKSAREGFRRSPHPRGDGPPWATVTEPLVAFSPPAWGWSDRSVNPSGFGTVLPTRVGMVRGRARA